MGRGTSSANGGNSAGTTALKLANETIDLTASPLKYGNKDSAVSGAVRQTIDTWESKRVANKIEYGAGVAPDGTIIEERRGGSGSVRVKVSTLDSTDTYSHVHPRDKGMLGGTFSPKDIDNFKTHKVITYRATAKEGTYSISKSANFNANGLYREYSKASNNCFATLNQQIKKVQAEYNSGKISYNDAKKLSLVYNNARLVNQHNWLMANQSKYGYTYTLEKRR